MNTLISSPNGRRTKRLQSVALLLIVFIAIYAGIVRPWFMQWGATTTEQQMALAGDSFIPANTVVSTRAITIHAPATQVWAWLVQLGQEHGGFYSYDWLENLFMAKMHNANQIVPEWQHPQVGDRVAMMANPPPVSIAKIALIEPPQMMVLAGGWAFYLQAIDPQTTRLVVRYASFPVEDSLGSAFYYSVFEPAHFVMEAGMMMGIKQRAERGAHSQVWKASDSLAKQEVTP